MKFLSKKPANKSYTDYSGVIFTYDSTYIDCDGSILFVYVSEDKRKWWYKNSDGEFHRLDGPSRIDHSSKFQAWYINGKNHRLNGPARLWSNRDACEYWVDGKIMLWTQNRDKESRLFESSVKNIFSRRWSEMYVREKKIREPWYKRLLKWHLN